MGPQTTEWNCCVPPLPHLRKRTRARGVCRSCARVCICCVCVSVVSTRMQCDTHTHTRPSGILTSQFRRHSRPRDLLRRGQSQSHVECLVASLTSAHQRPVAPASQSNIPDIVATDLLGCKFSSAWSRTGHTRTCFLFKKYTKNIKINENFI